jgi:hypothetical protein
MQEKLLFEYAVIRVVPRVEREEFLNVGIILYCRKRKFLECLTNINTQRLKAFCPALEINEVEQYLVSIQQVCAGTKEAGTIGQLDIASRFRWLTATRSTVVQSSKVHPGFCTDPKETLQHLYEQLIL